MYTAVLLLFYRNLELYKLFLINNKLVFEFKLISLKKPFSEVLKVFMKGNFLNLYKPI